MRSEGLPNWIERCLAGIALIVLSPLLILIAFIIRLESPGHPIFKQQRVGKDGAPFTLYKFRSMSTENSGLHVTAKGDSRITRMGRLLRKTKLDELPELYNILTGTMSFVGPRPEVEAYVDRSDFLWQEILRHRPGLTDPLTIHLRNEEELLASAEDPKSAYEKWVQPYKLYKIAAYLSNRSALSDIKVIIQTLVVILFPSRAPLPSWDDIHYFVEQNEA